VTKGYECNETAAPTGIANFDQAWCDSTGHRWKMINNNGTADTIVGAATTDTLTNKTLTSPTITNPSSTGTDSGTETLVNKTLTSPILTTPTLTGVTNGTGLQLFNTTTTCTTGATVGATCTSAAITLPVAYADTNYRLTCTGQTVTNVPIVETYTKSNTTFTITIAALTAAAATFTSYDCMATHN